MVLFMIVSILVLYDVSIYQVPVVQRVVQIR